MFEIGQQVVCIASGPWIVVMTFAPAPEPSPKNGGVYTIRGFETGYPETLGLCFEELPNSWSSSGFRPVRKTSIEQFRELLVTPPTTVPNELIDA